MESIDRIFEVIEASSTAGFGFDLKAAMLSLLLAFVLGQALAWVYYFTHSGLSYSKSFVQSLIILCVVIAMVMLTIGGSFVTAVGLMGALSIIRFRNMIKDTRDIAFIFIFAVGRVVAKYETRQIGIDFCTGVGVVFMKCHQVLEQTNRLEFARC